MYCAEAFGVEWNINHIRSLWFKSREGDKLKKGLVGYCMVGSGYVMSGVVLSCLVR